MYEGNIESFQSIIENYEILVKELNQELYSLKSEQDNLKTQLTDVIAENNKLSQNFQDVLTSRQSDIHHVDNEELVSNLRQQINTLITEKECVTKLWQEGIKTIDRLEDELKIYQAGTESFVPKKEFQKLKYFYEEKIHELDLKLATTQKKLEDSTKQAKAKIETKHYEIDQSLENQASALKIVKNLEAEVLKLQKRLQETLEVKCRLERAMAHKEDILQGLKKANLDCLSRVTEAVSIVEAALNEKDAALFREKGIKEENEKLMQEMTEIVNECKDKIKQETIRINAEHNEKQKCLLEKLTKGHNEIKNKSSEIEALHKKCGLLEAEIERMHKGHCIIEESDINKLLVLEKNLESTFQKLLVSEKQNIQLISEKEIMKNDLDQMANIYDRNLKAKEIEICTLNSKISRLETELNDSYAQVNQVTEKMSKVYEDITKTEKEFRDQKQNYEAAFKTQYDEKIEDLSRLYNSNLKELQLQIEKKNEINQKWRKEMKIITDNLEKLVSNLKQEVQGLKKDNKGLKENLRKSEEKVKQYKTFLELISKDVNKISHLTLGTGVS